LENLETDGQTFPAKFQITACVSHVDIITLAQNSTAQNRTEEPKIFLPHSSAQPKATAQFRTRKSASQFQSMPIIS